MTDPNASIPPTTTAEFRRRRTDKPDPSQKWFKLMAWVGAGTWVVVVGLELTVATINAFTERTLRFEFPHYVLYTTGIIGFVGFYGLNSRKARDAGEFIISAGERIITVVRTGQARRKSDAQVVVTTEVKPTPAPAEPEPQDHGPPTP